MYHPSNSTSFGYTDDLVRSLKGVPELRTKDQLSPEAGLQNIFKPRSSGTSGHSIVFIDRAIASYQELASDVTPGTEVITLDPSGDEIHQITNVLDQRHHITSLQIVSHGSAGGFQLGRTYYNLNTLSQRSSEVASWANALTPDANILLYGCAIAANHPGIQFIDYLSQITGANVAASNNLTGNALLGGDWNLEVATGEIDYGPAFNLKALEHYRGVLDTSYLSDLNWTAIANGWGPVEKNMSNGEQSAGDGHPLTLNGVTYAKGLGVHANSEVDYTLGGTYTNFLANIGIDAEVGGKGSVVFQVWGDGTQLYDSGLVTGLSSTKLVNVNVTGKQKLQLIVTDGGDGNGYDHADWANASLVSGPVTPPGLDTTPPTATLAATPLNASIAGSYTFNVTYADTTGVKVSTLNSSDIQVTGPGGFTQLAQLISATPNADSRSVTATYGLTAPDRIWNWNDTGTYTVTLLAKQVQDTLGNTNATDTYLGTFQAAVPSIVVIGVNSFQVKEGNTVTIPIQRVGDTTGSATINFYTGGNATAVANVNYVPIPLTTVTFAPGETQKNVTVQTLNDGVMGTNAVVSLLIDQPTGADLGPSRTSLITITDQGTGLLNTSYLSDLNWTAIANGWGPVEKNMSNGEQAAGDGHPLNLNGTTYTKGLGVHANSEVDYSLGGAYNSFTSYIGVDNEIVGGKGSVVFQVWGDGTQLYDSGLVTGLSSTKLVNVNVTGKQKLQLIVTDGGDGNGYDHADWAMAQLVIGAGSPLPPPALGLVSETVISGLIQPTTFDWSPDGQRMYIAQKNGVVQVAVNNVLQSKPFTDISAEVNDTSDRGLLGMAINPYFGQNKGQDFIYLSFTYDPPETRGQTGLTGPDANGNRPDRVVRVTADPTTNYTTAISGSEVVLLGKNDLWQYISRPDGDSTDDFSIPPSGIVNGTTIKAPPSLIDGNGNIRDYIADDSQSHSVGQLRFGLDGALYVSIGDGTSYNAVDRRAVRVQDVDNLSGKLLRIDPLTGQGLTDNPFYSGDPNSNRSKVWSYGFRNPFRFTIQPGTGNIYVGDVGWNTWEEIDVATKGGNFGWPYYEGVPQNAGYSNLPQAQSFYASGQPVVRPLLTRNHNPALNPDNLGSTALIMGTFYTGNVYPSNYQGALFYNDVGLGRVYSTLLNPDGTVKSTQLVDNIPYIVDMETGPDGYLYYDSLYGGQIDRWKLG